MHDPRFRRPGTRSAPWAVLLATLASCAGEPELELGPEVPEPVVRYEEPDLRRLTRDQFARSLAFALGEVPVGEIEPDLVRGGFASVGAADVVTSDRGVEQYAVAIDRAVDVAFSEGRSGSLPCDEAAGFDAECADLHVRQLGRRAWRRPLSEDEVSRYVALSELATRESRSRHGGLKAATQGLLLSPYHLYRLEEPVDGVYTGFAMASRLSFLLWGRPPDEALLDAAAAGQLDTPEGVRSVAQEMLDDPRSRDGIVQFVDELYQLHRIDGLVRDFVEVFGEDGFFDLDEGEQGLTERADRLKASMRREVEEIYADAHARDADLLDLLITERTMVDAQLAQVYELRFEDEEPEGDRWVPAERRRVRDRVGILGTMGLLSLYNKQNATSPTLRGLFVSETVLCREIPPPPPGAATGFEPPEDVSRREALGIHATDPTCASCHDQMDPMGFALDSFDVIGLERKRDDWGYRLNTRGELDGVPFNGLSQLSHVLRENPDTNRCFAQHIYRYADGSYETGAEEQAVPWLADRFLRNGHSWRATLLDFVVSTPFRGTNQRVAEPDSDTLADISSSVFAGSCAPCHTSSSLGGLSLADDAGLAQRLRASSLQAPGLPLVAPGEPDQSYLLHKLVGTHEGAGGSGETMPPGEPLSDEAVARVRAWILAGAL